MHILAFFVCATLFLRAYWRGASSQYVGGSRGVGNWRYWCDDEGGELERRRGFREKKTAGVFSWCVANIISYLDPATFNTESPSCYTSVRNQSSWPAVYLADSVRNSHKNAPRNKCMYRLALSFKRERRANFRRKRVVRAV